jgi:hypothetical protein
MPTIVATLIVLSSLFCRRVVPFGKVFEPFWIRCGTTARKSAPSSLSDKGYQRLGRAPPIRAYRANDFKYRQPTPFTPEPIAHVFLPTQRIGWTRLSISRLCPKPLCRNVGSTAEVAFVRIAPGSQAKRKVIQMSDAR